MENEREEGLKLTKTCGHYLWMIPMAQCSPTVNPAAIGDLVGTLRR